MNDTVVIGGVTYTVTGFNGHLATTTSDAGTTAGDGYVEIAMVDGSANPLHLLVPGDSLRDRENITEVNITTYNATNPISVNTADFDGDDTVTLSAAPGFDLYDAIEWDGTDIASGAVTLTAGVELTQVL